MTRRKKAKDLTPRWALPIWFHNDPERKDASIQIQVDRRCVYEVHFENVTEEELRQYGPVVLDLYLATTQPTEQENQSCHGKK